MVLRLLEELSGLGVALARMVSRIATGAGGGFADPSSDPALRTGMMDLANLFARVSRAVCQAVALQCKLDSEGLPDPRAARVEAVLENMARQRLEVGAGGEREGPDRERFRDPADDILASIADRPPEAVIAGICRELCFAAVFLGRAEDLQRIAAIGREIEELLATPPEQPAPEAGRATATEAPPDDPAFAPRAAGVCVEIMESG